MGQTRDLGRRIELHSMDPHCHDISLGLYRQIHDGRSGYLVHSYSAAEAAEGRLSAIRDGLVAHAGLVPMEGQPGLLEFPCGEDHEKALRRTFLEVCKRADEEIDGPLPLIRHDKKAECELTVNSEGNGQYRITAPESAEKGPRRVRAVARGFVKLCEMEIDESDESVVKFSCQVDHDSLMGSLFFRAQNVRSAMQEDELSAGRGVLAAPGSQDDS